MGTKRIDINADMGEGIGNDAFLMPYINSANISCGYHAGDENSIRTAIQLAKQNGVRIGAHISYYDRENFGRVEQSISNSELYSLIMEQLDYFNRLTGEESATLLHVKPHGALYNVSARDITVAKVIAQAVYDFDASLILFGLSNSHSIKAATQIGLTAWQEAFADRRYLTNGQLMPRKDASSVINNPDDVLQQVQNITENKIVISNEGYAVNIKANTVCVHGDHTNVVAYTKLIKQYMDTFTL